MKAKKTPIDEKSLSIPDEQIEILEYEYPAEKGIGKIVGDSADAVPELLKLLREEAKVI
jgi:electron transfer flavoprotein beta subunit